MMDTAEILVICRACPTWRADADRCGRCPPAMDRGRFEAAIARPTARCPDGRWSAAEPPAAPTLPVQIARYARAVAGWVAQGMPVRDAAEVERIFEQVCRFCALYDADGERCTGCGCAVKPAGDALLNKIAMGTQHCPKQYW